MSLDRFHKISTRRHYTPDPINKKDFVLPRSPPTSPAIAQTSSSIAHLRASTRAVAAPLARLPPLERSTPKELKKVRLKTVGWWAALHQLLKAVQYKPNGPIEFPLNIPNVTLSDIARVDAVDERESHYFSSYPELRYNYNAASRHLTLRMPAWIHGRGSLQVGGSILHAMQRAKFIKARHFDLFNPGDSAFILHDVSTTTEGFRNEFFGSRKQPDWALYNIRREKVIPTFVIETANTEPRKQLLEDKDMWLLGQQGDVCAVLLITIKIVDFVEDVDTPDDSHLREFPKPEYISRTDSDSDTNSDTNSDFEGKSMSTPSSDSDLSKFRRITGQLELWRLSPTDPLTTVCIATALLPQYPSRRSETVPIRLADLYGGVTHVPRNLKSKTDNVFEFPAVFVRDIIARNWDCIQTEKVMAETRKRKVDEMTAGGEDFRDRRYAHNEEDKSSSEEDDSTPEEKKKAG